jgi:hypothetical protein
VTRSGDGILQVPVEIDHNRNNPAAESDRRIPASIFLPFFGVSSRDAEIIRNHQKSKHLYFFIFIRIKFNKKLKFHFIRNILIVNFSFMNYFMHRTLHHRWITATRFASHAFQWFDGVLIPTTFISLFIILYLLIFAV